ncbi:cytochrome P450 [Xylariales sp. PMI_506]|nr:cytochrome P450 [Xylariales sp. PMI_506]
MHIRRRSGHRQMLNNYFTQSKINGLLPIFQTKAAELGDYLDGIITADQAADDTGVFDCPETFGRAMLDIIGMFILGVDLGSLQADPSDFSDPLDQNHVRANEYRFYDAWKNIFSADKTGSVLMFLAGHLPVPWLPFDANSKFKRANAYTFSTVRRLIRERQGEIGNPVAAGKASKSDDMLSFVVKESRPGGTAEGISEDHLVGHILQLVAAGHEPSADVLSWTVFELSRRPEIQDTLRAETTELLKRTPTPSVSDINSLVYLENVLKKSLRVWSPSTGLPREATEDLTIDGIRLPKGTTIDLVGAVTHLNPFIWGEDAETFDPTRWERLNSVQTRPYAFEAFSHGPRICIGRSFAILETKVVLMELVSRFRFLKLEKHSLSACRTLCSVRARW